MSDPRPPDERPIPGHPQWNEKALAQYADYIANQAGGEVEDDEDEQRGDAPELRWALGQLVARGRLEVKGRQGRRVRYGPKPGQGRP